MVKEKIEDTAADDILSAFESDAGGDGEVTPELDGAIGDLRGVLQNDAEGTLPELGEGDFGGDLSDFGGDLGSDFGGGDFGGGDLESDFGGSDFGSDLGGDFGGGASATPPGSALHSNIDLIMDIPIDVQIVLGKSHMNVATLMNLNEGATIALDRKIGEPVEILVNGRLIGRGEITVLDEDTTRFGVKLIEIMKVEKKG